MRLAVAPEIFEREELERWHGPLLPSADESHDHARAREDRLNDFHPARPLLLDDTRASRTSTPLAGVPTAVGSPLAHGGEPTDPTFPKG